MTDGSIDQGGRREALVELCVPALRLSRRPFPGHPDRPLLPLSEMAPGIGEMYRRDVRAILHTLSDAGYVIVPREPTEAMINAAPDLGAVDFYPSDVWRAMIAAALGEETP